MRSRQKSSTRFWRSEKTAGRLIFRLWCRTSRDGMRPGEALSLMGARFCLRSSFLGRRPNPAPSRSIMGLTGMTGLEDSLTGAKEIIRYVIPAECKREIRRDLAALGISAELLLHSLSLTILEDIHAIDRGESYPEPPTFEDP